MIDYQVSGFSYATRNFSEKKKKIIKGKKISIICVLYSILRIIENLCSNRAMLTVGQAISKKKLIISSCKGKSSINQITRETTIS